VSGIKRCAKTIIKGWGTSLDVCDFLKLYLDSLKNLREN